VYVHLTLSPGERYPLVFPSITLLCAFAFAHLVVVGVLAELVVRMGDFKGADTAVPSFPSFPSFPEGGIPA
jgi:hypothetical protein